MVMLMPRTMKKPEEMDELDLILLARLREDGKTQIKKLAYDMKVHPNTLLQRQRRLEDAGIVRRYIADVDFQKTEYKMKALVQIKARRGRAGDRDQISDLTKIEEIESIFAVTGGWDLAATVRVRDNFHLLEVLQKVGNHPCVSKTASSISLFEYKDEGAFNPFFKRLKELGSSKLKYG